MRTEFENAGDFALRLIKFRMRSKYEIEFRLKRKRYAKTTIEQVVNFLSNINYINDLAFAKAWVNSRLQLKPRSIKLIKY